jgi:hypothetical protein
MLQKMFPSSFSENINRHSTPTYPNENQFEVLVEKINGYIYLTHGWSALRDFITSYPLYTG